MGLGNPAAFLNYRSCGDGKRGEKEATDGWGGMPTGWGQRGNWGKPTSLQRHDAMYHGGHYDWNGACKYREEREKEDYADLFSYLGRGLMKHDYERPKRKEGAMIPLGTVSDVGPGRTTVLSSKDFKDVMASLPKQDRLFALSDIHDAGYDGIDSSSFGTVVIAGDFSQDGATSESRKIGIEAAVEGGKKWLEEKLFPKFERERDRRFVLIAGNHDHFLGADEANEIEWPENVDYLSDSEAVVNGLRVYGTPWCAARKGNARIYTQPQEYAKRPFEVDDATLAEKFAKIPEGLDVLVVHQPPKAEGFDGDISYAGGKEEHSGSEELTKAILRAKPKLVICGHLHDGDHRPFKIGASVVVNAAYVRSRSEPGYTAQEIGIERGDAAEGGNGFVLDGEDEHEM